MSRQRNWQSSQQCQKERLTRRLHREWPRKLPSILGQSELRTRREQSSENPLRPRRTMRRSPPPALVCRLMLCLAWSRSRVERTRQQLASSSQLEQLTSSSQRQQLASRAWRASARSARRLRGLRQIVDRRRRRRRPSARAGRLTRRQRWQLSASASARPRRKKSLLWQHFLMVGPLAKPYLLGWQCLLRPRRLDGLASVPPAHLAARCICELLR